MIRVYAMPLRNLFAAYYSIGNDFRCNNDRRRVRSSLVVARVLFTLWKAMEQFTLLFMDYLWNKGVQHTNELTTLKTQTDAQAQNSGRMNFIMTRLFIVFLSFFIGITPVTGNIVGTFQIAILSALFSGIFPNHYSRNVQWFPWQMSFMETNSMLAWQVSDWSLPCSPPE